MALVAVLVVEDLYGFFLELCAVVRPHRSACATSGRPGNGTGIVERRGKRIELYAENTASLSSGLAGGTTGSALAAAMGIDIIATILVIVTVVFTAMLLVRLARRGLRAVR